MTSIERARTLHKDFKSIVPELIGIVSKQTGIPKTDIYNTNSIRGATMTHYDPVTHTYVPYCADDLFIVFDFSTDSSINVSCEEDDGSVSNFTSIDLILYIYGDNSYDVAQKLKVRLFAEKVNNDMDAIGFHTEKIEQPEISNDFVNDTIVKMTKRTIVLGFCVKTKVDNADSIDSYDISVL